MANSMNKYEILGIIGEGAYGIVYKAKHKDNGDIGKYVFISHSLSIFFLLRNLTSFAE